MKSIVGVPLITILLYCSAVQAQPIVPDRSLNTTVNSSDGRNFTITNGTAASSNLFHSFQEFSVPTGGSATFDLINTPNIKTIFNRVTGSNISNIDGLIQTVNQSQSVNLFLLNPNGILFGSNAQLNVSGSFIGTTANTIHFEDGTQFNADQSPLLTMSAPVGLQFGQSSSSITVQGTGHRLTSQNPVFAPYLPTQPHDGLAARSITLIGHSVSLNNAILTAPEGHIEVGGVQQGFVGLTPGGLNYDRVSSFGDVTLTGRSLIDVNGINAGSIQVAGRHINLSDGSVLWVQNRGSQTAGDIRVTASQSLTLSGTNPTFTIRSAIVNETLGSGANGNIYIAAPQLTVQSGSAIFARNYGVTTGGNLNINAGQLEIVGYSAIAPDLFSIMGSFSFFTGNAGAVSVSAQQLSVRDGAYLGSTTLGVGRSGTLTINADTVEVRGVTAAFVPSSIAVSTIGLGGDAGDLVLNTRRLTLRDSGTIASSSIGVGSAGNAIVNATELIDIEGGITGLYRSAIASSVDVALPSLQRLFGLPTIPQGNAGSVIVNTPVLRVANNGAITVFNAGIGDAGTLTINAGKILLEQGGGLSALTAQGNGGNIAVEAQVLKLRQGSGITATALGRGDGGNIRLNVPVIVGLENSDIIANAIDGRGGSINITTQAILGLNYRNQLTPESDITASSQFGVAGTVQISTPDINPNSGLIQLPNSVINPNQHLANGCATNGESRFVITGRGGLPANPLEQIESYSVWADLRDLAVQNKTAPAIAAQSPIIEATTWYRDTTGKIVLSAGQPSQPAIAPCAVSDQS
ncbi:two-partner secretion domain-containing protein [Leptolyngbya sp. NIES-2104]|uniref:two-partner secretion domain-containing protein n=1 Tax=Leptolyngbya sp. NIES-2104 TaxID=1552121 RepID=UPI0006EC6727|nr:filamentous hemagglutinin N-terminal domain-containing protein [Leptolyngbya sp. NIES-2104]GAP99430.1 putative hemagglutinin-related protein [Leptolyngbya sp. NIES-2104]